MKIRLLLKFAVAGLLLATFGMPLLTARAQGTAFTYQGRLNDATNPATGSFDLMFTLFSNASGGPQVGSIITNAATAVSNGLFTVTLDFGATVFPGNSRWLEVAVRTNGGGLFSPLSPRQLFTATPYAITASRITGTIGAGQISGPLPVSQLAGTLADGQLSPNVALLNGTNVFWGTNNFINVVNANNTNNFFKGTLLGNVNGNATTANNFIGSLAGDVTGGQGTTAVASIGGQTSANVAAGVSAANAATTANSSNTIVKRDASGNFSAGTVTAASFTGDGSGVSNVIGALPWNAVSGTTQQAKTKNGYLLTNDSATVVVTLPVAPNVGDIVRVSGSGTNGWKILQNVGQTVVGDNLPNQIGTSWTAHDTNRNWVCVVSSADGSKLVALDYGGHIHVSGDYGGTWAAHANSRNWKSVASSADGATLVALDYGGYIYTSTNSGANWTALTYFGTGNWIAAAMSADGNSFWVAHYGDYLDSLINYGNTIFNFTNSGTSFGLAKMAYDMRSSGHAVSPALDTGSTWSCLAVSADGTQLTAGVSDTGGEIYTSTDGGASWHSQSGSAYTDWYSVASSADGTKRVAASDYLYTSTDSGANWWAGDSSRGWQSVASSADGSRLAAVAMSGYGYIYTSTDSGVTWTVQPDAGRRGWYSVASSADGTRLVAVVNGGQIYTSTSSTTAGTAGYLLGNQNAAIELQYVGNGKFIPISSMGTVQFF